MTKNNLHNILSNNFNLKLNIINDLQAHAKKSFIFHLVDENFVNSIKSEKNIDNTISSVWNNNVLKSMKNQMENEDFKGAEKTSMLLLSQCDQFERIYLIGVSKIIEEDKKNSAKDRNNDNQITEEKIAKNKLKFQIIGGKVADIIASNPRIDNIFINSIFITENFDIDIDTISLNIYYGFAQKIYKFSKYKTEEKIIEKLPKINTVNIVIKNQNFVQDKQFQSQLTEINALLKSIYLIRNLVNEPGNVLYPESYADIIVNEMKGYKNITIEIFDEKELKKLNANTLLAVAQGSDKKPKMLVIHYNGNKKSKDINLALVGKGVTFDSGGLSLKPGNSMIGMHGDMAGSATVYGSIRMIAEQELEVNVVGVIGLVENMPSDRALKVNDIIQSMSGKTIEILNTDAEGRLVLADLLYYTETNFKPKYMIDFATLTGAIVVALGEYKAGLYSNSKKLADMLFQCGENSGDYCWKMPLGNEYSDDIKSSVADLQNVCMKKGEAGSITAAAFLQEFIDNNKNWAHLDIAGASDTAQGNNFGPKGPTGYGVKLVNEFAKLI